MIRKANLTDEEILSFINKSSSQPKIPHVALETSLAHRLVGKESANSVNAQAHSIIRIETCNDLKNLRCLDISYNPIKSLDNIDQFPMLKSLSCYACSLEDTDGLRGTPKLEILYLQQNKIKNMSFALTSMNKLKELRLDHNHLTAIVHLNSCSSLRALDISYNRINSLDGISGLQSLQELKACNNNISSLKPLKALPCLVELHVSGNLLKSLNGIQQLPTLQVLYAEHNQLDSLSIPQTYSHQNKPIANLNITATATATDVKASGNRRLSGSKSVQSSKSMKAADVAAAATIVAATKKNEVLGMQSLTDVFLSNNSITSFEGIDRLGASISHLDISYNTITDVDSIVSHLSTVTNLKSLKLMGNPLLSNDQSVKAVVSSLLSTAKQLQSIDDIIIPDKDIIKESDFSDDESRATVTVMKGTADDNSEVVDNSDDDDDDDDKHVDDEFTNTEARNAAANAPTLSLKNLYNIDDIERMEGEFTRLLNESKQAITSIFNFNYADPPLVLKRELVSKTLKSILRKDNSAQLSAQDVVAKKAVADLAVLKASIKKVMINDYTDASTIGNATDSSSATAAVDDKSRRKESIVNSNDADNDTYVGGSTFISEAIKLSSDNNSVGGSSTGVSSSGGRLYTSYANVSKHMQLGSGLTRHGTKIKGSSNQPSGDDFYPSLLTEVVGRYSLIDKGENRINSSSSSSSSSHEDDRSKSRIVLSKSFIESYHKRMSDADMSGEDTKQSASPSTGSISPRPFSEPSRVGVGYDARQHTVKHGADDSTLTAKNRHSDSHNSSNTLRKTFSEPNNILGTTTSSSSGTYYDAKHDDDGTDDYMHIGPYVLTPRLLSSTPALDSVTHTSLPTPGATPIQAMTTSRTPSRRAFKIPQDVRDMLCVSDADERS